MKSMQAISIAILSSFFSIGILSLTGFGTPNSIQPEGDPEIGTIKIWPGNPNAVPEGWRICDGSPLKKTSYPDLYEKIGSYWDQDEGYNADFFRIPDLRGVFIRGVNGDRSDKFQDSEKGKRIRLFQNSGIDSNAAGSFQLDEIGKHSHHLLSRKSGGGVSDALSLIDASAIAGHNGGTEWSARHLKDYEGIETRPKNAYVHFIIKVK
jgi:microcystin-dependent protein